MEKEELYNKIKKLLDMASSNNQNEAEIATQKVNEILLKYNLNMQSVKDKDFEYIEKVIHTSKQTPYEMSAISHLLNEYFFVEVYFSKKIMKGLKSVETKIFGKTENTKIAEYIFVFLLREYKKLWSKYKKINKHSRKHSYMLGLTLGIKNKLDEIKIKVESETGLIVIKDEKLEEKIKDIKVRKTKTDASKDNSFFDGVEDSKTINIYKPISSEEKKSVDRKLYITN